MQEQLAVSNMVAALRGALADCVSGSECQRLLEECLDIVDHPGITGIADPSGRLARARMAAQALRRASLQPSCADLPSMENARRAMSALLFEFAQPLGNNLS
jgi:hypothetical protein